MGNDGIGGGSEHNCLHYVCFHNASGTSIYPASYPESSGRCARLPQNIPRCPAQSQLQPGQPGHHRAHAHRATWPRAHFSPGHRDQQGTTAYSHALGYPISSLLGPAGWHFRHCTCTPQLLPVCQNHTQSIVRLLLREATFSRLGEITISSNS